MSSRPTGNSRSGEPTRSSTVGRPCGSFAVVTTPAGLCSSTHACRSALTGRPSTHTSSPSPTLVPSSATVPFTVTRASRISSSTARRDPTPAEARYRLSLTGTLVGDQVQARSQRLVIGLGQLEVRQRRQILALAQAEYAQEGAGRAVDDRRARGVGPPRLLDQTPLDQPADGRVGADAADAGDLGPRHRLQIGHDRQRLQRGLAEALGVGTETLAIVAYLQPVSRHESSSIDR